MAINEYDTGDQVRMTATFKNAAGALADPTTVVFKYRQSGSVAATTLTYGVDGAVVKASVGVYHLDITPAASGDWHYRAVGTGAVVAAAENSFRVLNSFFD